MRDGQLYFETGCTVVAIAMLLCRIESWFGRSTWPTVGERRSTLLHAWTMAAGCHVADRKVLNIWVPNKR
jgi:hypothetical protein